MPKIEWIPVAQFALDNHVSRQHVYRAIRRGDVACEDWRIDANGQYVIKSTAPAPPKHEAGRKAEIKKHQHKD